MIHLLQLGIKIIAICFFLLLSYQSLCQKRIGRKDKKTIIRKLDSLSIEDQKYRIPILYGTTNQLKLDSMRKLPTKEKIQVFSANANNPNISSFRDSLTQLMQDNDKTNFICVNEIINNYGFPEYYKNYKNILLIIEHSILYNPTYLDTVKVFMINQDITPWDYAVIYDRYLRLKGENLMYGTRGKYNFISSCEECNEINKARQEIGIKKMLQCDDYR